MKLNEMNQGSKVSTIGRQMEEFSLIMEYLMNALNENMKTIEAFIKVIKEGQGLKEVIERIISSSIKSASAALEVKNFIEAVESGNIRLDIPTVVIKLKSKARDSE
jgi:hypothetical protein